jgi:archaetidylinositol phosphate synthase
MIDGLFKHRIDPFWNFLARGLARKLTANQVTFLGLLLVAAAALAYLHHRSPLWFGLSLALAFSADSLDGAVARLRGETSHLGGYLDAMIDRYQEIVVLMALAIALDAWAPAFLACTGALLTSYAKARTALEVPVPNTGWPDLFERQERIIFLCALLIFGPWLGGWMGFGTTQVLGAGLWLLAALCHATAIQRMLRAARLLQAADAKAAFQDTQDDP